MASRLYNYFLYCWMNGVCSEEQLQAAVDRGYITEDEYQQIISTPRNQ